MNLQHAQNSYRRATLSEDSVPADPHAIIGVALSELQGALKTLARATETGRSLPPVPVSRALSAIYLLQSSLDFEQGGEIAPALFRVYEYCRQQALAALARAPGETGAAPGLTQAAEFVSQLTESWRAMKAAAPVPA